MSVIKTLKDIDSDRQVLKEISKLAVKLKVAQGLIGQFNSVVYRGEKTLNEWAKNLKTKGTF